MSWFRTEEVIKFHRYNKCHTLSGFSNAIQHYYAMFKQLHATTATQCPDFTRYLIDIVLVMTGNHPTMMILMAMSRILHDMKDVLSFPMPVNRLQTDYPYSHMFINHFATWAFPLLEAMPDLNNWHWLMRKATEPGEAHCIWEYRAPFPASTGKRSKTRIEWRGGDTVILGIECTFCVMDTSISFWCFQHSLPFEHLLIDEPYGLYQLSGPWPVAIDRLSEGIWWDALTSPPALPSPSTSCCGRCCCCPPPAKKRRLNYQ